VDGPAAISAAAMLATWITRAVGVFNLAVFVLVSFVVLAISVPLQLAALPWDPLRRVSGTLTRWIWGVGHIAVQPFWRLTVTGRERLGGAACIYVANHQSMLDIPLLMHLGEIRVVARPGVFRLPGIGAMARLTKHVEIDATSTESVTEALATCKALLAAGVSIAMFPEGTRGDGGELGKEGDALATFQRGAFQLAVETGARVVPVAISGTARALPKGTVMPRDPLVRMHLAVLPPLQTTDLGSPPEARRKLARAARDGIVATLNGPRPWEIAARVGARYPGGFRAGWARGKTSFDPIYWMLHERLPATGRLWDVGAGEGLLGWYLREAGHDLDYTAWDVDADRLAVGRATFVGHEARLRAGVGDARTLLPDGVDHVVIIDVLHYLGAEEQAGVLSRLIAGLAPGGTLWVRDPEVKGARGAWTVGSERAMVATGRHRGEGVHPMGGAWLRAQLERSLEGVTVVEGSPGTPFHNVLVGGRKPASAERSG